MRTKIIFFVAGFLFASALLIESCKYEKVYPADSQCPDTISYSNNVFPLIEAHCVTTGCHESGSGNGDFTTYAGIKSKADNGRLRLKVVEEKSMPPDNSISVEQRTMIDCWIKQGAASN